MSIAYMSKVCASIRKTGLSDEYPHSYSAQLPDGQGVAGDIAVHSLQRAVAPAQCQTVSGQTSEQSQTVSAAEEKSREKENNHDNKQ